MSALTLAPACRLAAEGQPPAARERAPEFELVDQRGATVSLTQLIATGPAIVVFYRGFW